MRHDPIHKDALGDGDGCRVCDLIRKAREDERRKAAKHDFIADTNDGYADGYTAALRDAVEAVKAVPAEWTTDGDDWIDYPGSMVKHKAVAAIKALGGER